MKFFLIFFFIFNFANAESYLYNFETKKFLSNIRNFTDTNKIIKKKLEGSYEVYLLGKKNNLNDVLNEVIWKSKQDKLVKKSRKVEYYSIFNKKFLEEKKLDTKFTLNLKNFIFKKNINSQNTKKKILNNNEYVNKEFNYQLFKSLNKINEHNIIRKYAKLDKWQYEIIEKVRKIAVVQRLLDTELNFLPIFSIENFPNNQLYEVNFRLKVKYKNNLNFSKGENIKIITNKDDWFISGENKLYISFKNILNKYYKLTENNIDKIKIDEIYLHINDQGIQNNIFPKFKFSYFDLKEIYLDDKILIFSQDFLKNKNYVDTIKKYKDINSGNIQVKIKKNYEKISITQDKVFNNSIKFYLGDYKNIEIENLDIINYDFLYENFSEVYLFFKDKNNLKIINLGNEEKKIKIEKRENKNFYLKGFFAVIKTFYPIVIFLVLISYPILIYNFYNIKKLKNNLIYFLISNIIIFILFKIGLFNINLFLWLLLYNFITFLTLNIKNPLIFLLKGNCICVLLILFTYILKLKIISGFISYFCLILMILAISRMLIKIRSNANTSY